MPTAPWILAVVQDLMFTVQISDLAKRGGFTVRYVRQTGDALAQAAEQPDLVLIDLNIAGLDTVDLIRQLKAARPAQPVAAYVSHVQVELRRGAAEAGADPVLPRSAFATKLPLLLQTLAPPA